MKIIASFDDGSYEDMLLADIMSEYNIPTIFYFPSNPHLVNESRGRISLDANQRQEIASRHEIGSHTMTHPLLTRISHEAAWNEIYESRLALKNEFRDQEINSFCYPRGYSNPDLEILVQDAGYTNARGVTVGYLDKPENPFYMQTTVHVGADRKEYAGLGWFEYAMRMVDLCTPSSTYHLWGHGWEMGQHVENFILLRKLLDRLAERTIEVMPIGAEK